MAARAIGSATLTFGLVSVPVKLYAATSRRRPLFHLVHRKCGTRVRMRYFCPFDGEVLERDEMVKGFKREKDDIVLFSEEELERLESERSDRIELIEFVPEASVDLVYLQDTRYVGPGRGGERAFRLLADAMKRTRRIAVGRHGSRGREQLVLLRPYRGGLALHHMYYADEVRPVDEIELPRRMVFREAEEELADRLIERLSADAFEPEKFHDEYRDRVLAAVEHKAAGHEIAPAPAPPDEHVLDLLDALKRSLTGRPRAGEVRGRARAEPSLSADARPAALAPRAKGILKARRERGPLRKAVPRRRAGHDKTGTGE